MLSAAAEGIHHLRERTRGSSGDRSHRAVFGELSMEAGDIVLRDVAESDLPILFEHQSDPEASRMAAFVSRLVATTS